MVSRVLVVKQSWKRSQHSCKRCPKSWTAARGKPQRSGSKTSVLNGGLSVVSAIGRFLAGVVDGGLGDLYNLTASSSGHLRKQIEHCQIRTNKEVRNTSR